jgi:hypothetical protein
MTDVVFRQPSAPEPAENKAKEVLQAETTIGEVKEDIEPPYTEYTREKGKSYIADYYGIGEGWDEKHVFGDELNQIEAYFENLIERGEISNDTQAVKTLIKKYEKILGLDKTQRAVIKIAKVAEYTKFLEKAREIDINRQKYGTR